MAMRGQPMLYLAAVVVAAMLVPLQADAFEPAPSAHAARSNSSLRVMSEEELRRVFGRALPEERLMRATPSMSSGFVVNIIGDMATLLSPLSNLLDAEASFRDALFNPLNPHVLIDKSGSYMIRVPDSIGMLNFENIHVRDSHNNTFGNVTIRNIDLRGTTIRVTLRR